MSEIADGSISAETVLGTIAEETTRSIAEAPAIRPARTKRIQTGGGPVAAATARAAATATRAYWQSSRSRRRSKRSARAPPKSEARISGPSSARPISPVRKAEPVITNTW